MSSLINSIGRFSRSGKTDVITRVSMDLELGKVQSFRKNRQNIVSDGVYSLIFETTSLSLLAFRRNIISTTPLGVINFYSDPTYSGGTDISATSIQNQNIMNPVVTTVKAIESPTVTDVGTEADEIMIRGVEGQGNSSTVGRAQVEGGFLLAPNRSYLIEITNLDASTHEFDFFFQWSETEPSQVGVF